MVHKYGARRILRFSGDGETSLPPALSNLALWVDYSDLSTLDVSLGAIAQVDDKSGLSIGLTQSVAANQPQHVAGELNGLAVSQYDGVNDALSNYFYSPTARHEFLSYVVLCKNNATAASSTFRVTLGEDGNSRSTILRSEGVTTMSFFVRTDAGGDINLHAQMTIGVWNTFVGVRDGDTASLYKNGVLETVGSAVGLGLATTTSVHVGSKNGSIELWEGQVGEALIYNKALSFNEVTEISSYFFKKWGV